MAGLDDAEHHTLQLQAPHQLIRSAGRTAQEHGACRAAAGLDAAESGVLVLDFRGLGALTIHIALDHRIPALGQVIDHLVARIGVVQWQATGHDQWIVVAVLPQAMDHLGHQLEHTTRPLKVIQRGPVLVQPVEYLWVNRVGMDQPFVVATILGFLWEVVAVIRI
ncbi:hypothetical protein D9M69_524280 [compost metagenome]